MDYAIKAMDSVTDANYERKDLSDTITLKDGPPRPFLQAIGDGKAKGKTHYWDEVGLNAPGHGNSSYAEGNKPTSQTNAPSQRPSATWKGPSFTCRVPSRWSRRSKRH